MFRAPERWLAQARLFVADKKGNFTILLAFSALPLILIIGLTIDYYIGLSMKARLDEASDAAAVAAVSTATNYVKANSTTQSSSTVQENAIAAGKAQALKTFMANVGAATDATTEAISPTIELKTQTTTVNGKTANSFEASISYSVAYHSAFGPLVGVSKMPVSGSSTAAANFPTYISVVFLIDASGSMGIGATQTDQNTMQTKTGCTVACHNPWNGHTFVANAPMLEGTYQYVRDISPAVTLRIDVVREAVINELKVMKATGFPGQIQVAIYLFSNSLQTVLAPTTDLDAAIAAASRPPDTNGAIDLLSGANEGGTFTTRTLDQLAQLLPSTGNGTAANSRLGSVLFFTDGVQDDSTPTSDGGEPQWPKNVPPSQGYVLLAPYEDYNDSTYVQGLNASDCRKIKSAGYSMFTLDFIYLVTQADIDSDSRYAFIQNTLNPSIKSNLETCASSSSQAAYASTPQEFDDALSSLMTKVLANVRITQ